MRDLSRARRRLHLLSFHALTGGYFEMAKYDECYKLLFSHPEMVQGLVAEFVDQPLARGLDFTTLECLSSEHIASDLRRRHNDAIWRVRCDDEWLYLYLMLEFQSTVDRFMACRVMTYVGLLHEDLVRKNHLVDGLLPPVLPIVLYNGGPRWCAATDVDDITKKLGRLDPRYFPKLSYMLIDEGAYDTPALESRNSPVSMFFLLENTQAKDRCLELVIRLADMLTPNAELQRTFLIFADEIYFEGYLEVDRMYHDGLDNKEVRTMLQRKGARFIQEWKAEGKAEGIAEGMTKGMAKGDLEARRKVAERILLAGMPTSLAIEFTQLSEEEIARIRKSIAN